MTQITKPSMLIDSHIHLFNARSLPLRGIIRRVPVIKYFSWPLSIILNAITAKFDIEVLDEELPNFTNDTPDEEIIDWIIERTQLKLYEEIGANLKSNDVEKKLRASELFSALMDMGEELGIQETGQNNFDKNKFLNEFVQLNKSSQFIKSNKRAAFAEAFDVSFKLNLKKVLGKFSEKSVKEALEEYIETEGKKILVFLVLMLSNEAKIYRKGKNGYGEKEPDLLVHHMMDMDASYVKADTYYNFNPTQTNQMMQLVNTSGGKLVGFTAFNPMRSDAMASVKKGLAAGNVGVKFYPPMGYLPFGDKDSSVSKNVKTFFEMCKGVGDGNEIPVFTHCTPVGFQAGKDFGLNSDPLHWEELLKQPGNSKLRICFGHAGGGDPKVSGYQYHGWYADENQWNNDVNNYARKVVDLCQRFENVYCEVAFLDEVLKNNPKGQNMIENLIRNFNTEGATYKLKDKICFGSDWHMLGMVTEQENYYKKFVEIFQNPNLKPSIDHFFSKNFIRFLNIPAYLSRIEDGVIKPENRAYLQQLHARL